jgi:hypothetical protein
MSSDGPSRAKGCGPYGDGGRGSPVVRRSAWSLTAPRTYASFSCVRGAIPQRPVMRTACGSYRRSFNFNHH